MTVGVLALQGDFREHEEVLKRLAVPTVQVKLPQDLEHVDRLIIPGGESTTIGKLLVMYKLLLPIRARIKKGMPVWGTCAGAILLAKHIADDKKEQQSLAVMDITARRNAFGRQLDSFETTITVKEISKDALPVVFIRAPILQRPGKHVVVLAKLENGTIIAARQGNMLATCFHPELTERTDFHRYFLSLPLNATGY